VGGCTHVVTFSRIGTRFSSQGGGTTFALRVWRQIDRVTLDLVDDQFTGKPLAHECLVGSVHIAIPVRPIDLSRLLSEAGQQLMGAAQRGAQV